MGLRVLQPLDDAESESLTMLLLLIVLPWAGPTPQDPLAFVGKFLGRVLESDGRGGLESAAEPDTTPDTEIRYRAFIQHSPTFLLY